MTDEEKEVIEAATAWRQDPSTATYGRLMKAIDALPKPYEPLVSDDELVGMNMRAALIRGLHGMAHRLANNGYVEAADVVEGTAEQEEKFNV